MNMLKSKIGRACLKGHLCRNEPIKKLFGGINRYGLWRAITGLFAFFRIKLIHPKSSVISTATDGLKINFNYPEQFIPTLALFRELAEPEYEFLRRVISKDSVFFDVGAGIGTYSIFTAQFTQGPIHAFEPIYENMKIFKKNIEANFKSINVRLNLTALSNIEGFGSIHKANNLFGSWLENESTEYSQDSIQVTTLDAYCLEHQIKQIDILKIDVEGHELKVLEGARESLAKKIIHVMILEDNHNVEKIADFLRDYQYLFFFFDYRDNSLVSIWPVNEERKNQLRPSIFSSNILLIQEESFDLFQHKFVKVT